MLNSKTNVFLTSGMYHTALKQCGFGTLRGNLLKQESVCLRERAGRGAREGPTGRGNPELGGFPRCTCVGGAFPSCQGAPQCTPGAPDSPWKSFCSPQRGWGSAPGQSHLFYPSTHLHSTGLGNCVTTQRWVFKTDQAGSTALHIQLRCAHKLPSLCAGK